MATEDPRTRIRHNGSVISGVLPSIQTYASFVRVTKLCGTYIPEAIRADLEPIKNDDQKAEYGAPLAIIMVRRLVDEGGLRGFHFCTLDLEKSVERILANLGRTPRHAKQSVFVTILIWASRTLHGNTELIVTPRKRNQLRDHRQGWVNYAATWDEFSNGRFGEFPRLAWQPRPWSGFGRILTLDDITALSLRFLQGEITAYPFSPAPLSSESQLILPHPLRLAKNGWWPSDHSIVSWGPAGGYVCQKSFVEFFGSEQVVERLEKAVEKAKGIVDFLAGNKMVHSQLASVDCHDGG
ncbi:Methylenetetrahydrofolate reductase domain containing protein [Lactarius tabidus]